MMADGRSRETWEHTSNLLAMLINANPFRSGAAADPAKFNPYRDESGTADSGAEPTRISFRAFAEALAQKDAR